MKKIIIACLAVATCFTFPQVSSAQGILKKINKGIQKVNKALEGAETKVDLATNQAVKQADGALVYNPLKDNVDIQLVGAYGVSTSENYGNVELVLKVNVKIPETSIRFGGNAGSRGTMAFDADGNVYKMVHASIGENFDVTEGLTIRILLDGDNAFQKVKKSVTEFPVVKLFTHLNWDNREEITFKNVPVQWDVEH